jgi:hypothetical protein
MAIRLSDIPEAPTKGIRLSDISLFPSGADPDKPLGFIRDIIPPAPTADRIDPKDIVFDRRPRAGEDVGLLFKQLATAPARGIETMIGTAGSMMRWASERAKRKLGNIVTKHIDTPGVGVAAEYLIRKYGPEKPLEFYDKQMDEFAGRGKQWADFWEEQTQKGWEAPDPKVVEAKWRDMPITKGVATIFEAAPNYLAAIATSVLTKSPQTGLLFISSVSGAGAYRRQREAGAGPVKAEAIATLTGAWEYVTELVPFEEVFKPAKNKLLKMLKLGTMESAQEFIQGIGENFLEYFGYEAKDLASVPDAVKEGLQHTMDNWVENVVAGAGLGVIGGGVMPRAGVRAPTVKKAPMRLEDVPVFPAEKLVAEAPPALEKKAVFKTEPEAVEVAPEAKAEPALPEIVSPRLYIGNVTRRMKKVFGQIFGVPPQEVKPFTEAGFPTKRTGIEVTRAQAQEALDILTEDLNRQFRENRIRTENQLALANAHWGDIVQLREVLGLPKIARPFKVIRAKKPRIALIDTIKDLSDLSVNELRELAEVFELKIEGGKQILLHTINQFIESAPDSLGMAQRIISRAKEIAKKRAFVIFKTRKQAIEATVQPSKMFDAGMTVQQVLQATMKKAEVVSAKAWMGSAKAIVTAHKDLARYASEKLRGLDVTQAERDRLMSFVAKGRTNLQKRMAIAGVEMLAEKADKRQALTELREEVSKIKTRIGKTMQEKGIRPEYARKLNTLIDSFRTKKLTLWRLSNIGSLKNYLSNLKEGISSDPTIDETYSAKLAELLIPETRLRQLDELSKSAINLLKAADIRTITTELKRLVNLNDIKNKLYLGRTARHAAEYLNRAITEQKKVKDNSKIVKQQTAWTTKQKGGALREVWRYIGGIHNQDVKTLVWNIEGGKQGALYDVLVEGLREGRRIESEHEKKITKYITGFLDQHKITPADLSKLSSTFQQVFRDPQQKARRLFGVAVPTYKIGKTSWSMAELMSMYLHTKNDFSLKAMVNEGIASILEEKGPLSADELAQVTTLVENNRVAKRLTEMYEHIAENINKSAINAVSLVLKGIEIADVNNYFTVERRSPGKIAGNQEFRISLLESQGFLLERTGSKNPIVIRDFFAVLNANIKGVAEYVGMAKPFRAAHTILSYKPLLKSIDAKGREVHRRHVNTLIERAESKLRPRGKIEAVFAKVLRAVPRAVLASPGIMGGQIMSEISYAATDIPTKYLVLKNPVPSEKQVERVGEHFAWAWARKHLGATSIETRNISSTDALLRVFTGKKAIINLPTQGINYVDMKAITFGWLAAERWVKDTTDLTGDAFYEEVNKRAHKAISESQPMFETENRSVLTSSENVIARSFVMFRSYIDQTLRIFARAQQGRANRTISRAKSARMMGAVLAGFVAWKTMRLLIDALLFRKKKDPYEIAKDVVLSPLRAFNLVGYQVERQVSRMLDIWTGRKPRSRYWDTEFENLVMSAINEVWKATKDFSDAMAYYGTDEVYKSGPNKGRLKSDVLLERAVTNLVLSIGKVYGLPTPVVRKALFSLKKKSPSETGKPIFKKRVG